MKYTKNIQHHPLFGHNKIRKLHWTNYPPFIEHLSDNLTEGEFLKQDGATAHTATYFTVIALDIFKARVASCSLWSALSPSMTTGDCSLWINLKGSTCKYDQKKPRTQYRQLTFWRRNYFFNFNTPVYKM